MQRSNMTPPLLQEVQDDSRSGNPMYRRALVTFIDILGFGQIVGSKSQQQVAKILELFNLADYGRDKSTLRTVRFSDSVLRVRSLDQLVNERSTTGPLSDEIVTLHAIQLELLRHGVLVRGAITFGKIFTGDDIVYGPAFVEAYEVEQSMAKYPRIVVADSVLKAFHPPSSPLRTSGWQAVHENGLIAGLLKQSEDGVWFLDYFGATLEMAFISGGMDIPDLVTTHARLIRKGLKASLTNPAMRMKYSWLARYHNEVCVEMNLHSNRGIHFVYGAKLRKRRKVGLRDLFVRDNYSGLARRSR